MLQQVSSSSPDLIIWNTDSQGGVGICCHYKRPNPSRFSRSMIEMSGSSLRARQSKRACHEHLAHATRVEVQGHFTKFAKHARSALKWSSIHRAICNNCPLIIDRKSIITCDVCGGQLPLDFRGHIKPKGYSALEVEHWLTTEYQTTCLAMPINLPASFPGPRPALLSMQYRKAGRDWYNSSRKHDIFIKWQNFQNQNAKFCVLFNHLRSTCTMVRVYDSCPPL